MNPLNDAYPGFASFIYRADNLNLNTLWESHLSPPRRKAVVTRRAVTGCDQVYTETFPYDENSMARVGKNNR